MQLLIILICALVSPALSSDFAGKNDDDNWTLSSKNRSVTNEKDKGALRVDTGYGGELIVEDESKFVNSAEVRDYEDTVKHINQLVKEASSASDEESSTQETSPFTVQTSVVDEDSIIITEANEIETTTITRDNDSQATSQTDQSVNYKSNVSTIQASENDDALVVVADANDIPSVDSQNLKTEDDVKEEDINEAVNYGMQEMNNLYYITEPKLYSMGLYLGADNPAKFVASFSDQKKEAKLYARFGYAMLQASKWISDKYPGLARQLPLTRMAQKSTVLQKQCPRKDPPICTPASQRYRTADGTCNNPIEPRWGSAMSTMQRFMPAVYNDGIQSVRRSVSGRFLPSAREVSDVVHEDRDVPLASVTHMLMQWGQFVDHDITATGQSRAFNGTVPQCCADGGAGFQRPEFMHPDCLPIAVGRADSHLSRFGVRCLEFVRSGPAPNENCDFGPREQLSQVTSYLDGSAIYSSNAQHSDSLRIMRNGLLQYGKLQSRKPVLPRQEDADLCKLGSLSTTCFRAGDGRISETPALTSVHVVFLRLHNRLATELAALNPHWSDEKTFQETRRIVGALLQHITYREFLPIVLGPQVMEIFDLEVLKKGYYELYDQNVNPNIANSFSTAAFRFGHSMVQPTLVRYDSFHRPLLNNVTIHEEFTNQANLETPGSVDRLLLGLVNQHSQRRDEFISEELTNRLFQTPGFPFGMDLAAINIQRGRDHGLPAYADWRIQCGLSPVNTWRDLEDIMSIEAMRKFRFLYKSVKDVDLFPAGLAERPLAGALVGPTFACIIAQQFGNLRRGDRFWYENSNPANSFTPGQLQQIRRVSLAQILCKTMDDIQTIQPFVFIVADNQKNARVACGDPRIGEFDTRLWAESNAIASRNIERTNSEVYNPVLRVNSGEPEAMGKFVTTKAKPIKTNIRQHNKISVTRPLAPHENLTIVVNNNAVNSPTFVNDAIYAGSELQINRPSDQKPNNANKPVYQAAAAQLPAYPQRPTYGQFDYQGSFYPPQRPPYQPIYPQRPPTPYQQVNPAPASPVYQQGPGYEVESPGGGSTFPNRPPSFEVDPQDNNDNYQPASPDYSVDQLVQEPNNGPEGFDYGSPPSVAKPLPDSSNGQYLKPVLMQHVPLPANYHYPALYPVQGNLQGYSPNLFAPGNIYYDQFPTSTPFPNLYTYYTHFHKPTQRPNYEVNNAGGFQQGFAGGGGYPNQPLASLMHVPQIVKPPSSYQPTQQQQVTPIKPSPYNTGNLQVVSRPVAPASNFHDNPNPARPFDEALGVVSQQRPKEMHKQKDSAAKSPTRKSWPTELLNSDEHKPVDFVKPHVETVMELPRPFVSLRKDLVREAVKTPARVRKPGQYYYDNNVLYRYPLEEVSKSSEDASIKSESPTRGSDGNLSDEIDVKYKIERVNSSNDWENTFTDLETNAHVVREDADFPKDEGQAETTTTDANNNQDYVIIESLENDRPMMWTNPQEISNISAAVEMPPVVFASDQAGSASAMELPKPINVRKPSS